MLRPIVLKSAPKGRPPRSAGSCDSSQHDLQPRRPGVKNSCQKNCCERFFWPNFRPRAPIFWVLGRFGDQKPLSFCRIRAKPPLMPFRPEPFLAIFCQFWAKKGQNRLLASIGAIPGLYRGDPPEGGPMGPEPRPHPPHWTQGKV